jgi:uncharacterized protein with HEPN domain
VNNDRLYLESILECLHRIAEYTSAHSHLPWRQIAGMRDVIIHDYLKVNQARAWQTIVTDLSPLRATVQPVTWHKSGAIAASSMLQHGQRSN